VTVERIGPVLGRVPAQVMAEVDEALRLHLQL
jgi:mRNA interferase MazF